MTAECRVGWGGVGWGGGDGSVGGLWQQWLLLCVGMGVSGVSEGGWGRWECGGSLAAMAAHSVLVWDLVPGGWERWECGEVSDPACCVCTGLEEKEFVTKVSKMAASLNFKVLHV